MKRIFLVLVVASVSMISCKKEADVKPIKMENATMAGGATRNMGGWD